MLTPSLHLTLLLLLPTTALAGGPPQPVPPKVDPTPLENFTWTDPFPRLSSSASGSPLLTAACESTRTFSAWEYQLHDLHEPEPRGLAPYGDALKTIFGGRAYPGGWDGLDAHGYERTLLKMAYADVPLPVRTWIAEQELQPKKGGKGLYAVYDKPKRAQRVTGTADLSEEQGDEAEWDAQRVVIFAPGALYENLPLWVAEGSACEATLRTLDRYSPKLVDGGVVGWPTDHTTPSRRQGQRQIEFTIKAQVLSAQVEADASSSGQKEQGTVVNKDEL